MYSLLKLHIILYCFVFNWNHVVPEKEIAIFLAKGLGPCVRSRRSHANEINLAIQTGADGELGAEQQRGLMVIAVVFGCHYFISQQTEPASVLCVMVLQVSAPRDWHNSLIMSSDVIFIYCYLCSFVSNTQGKGNKPNFTNHSQSAVPQPLKPSFCFVPLTGFPCHRTPIFWLIGIHYLDLMRAAELGLALLLLF